ncbi:hypothetical protein EB796_007007 [Bugula neritina]|uniref:Uncharacterized protein n=1 Tax=Bugula neritina TaxID=10212 RepID=A0A7J7KA06_BUGNE|nr:hypothetical protein EB796_007007 [Bugula neritina]
MVLLKLQVAVFVLATVDALTCDWTSGVGKLDPYITSGNIKSFSVNSEDECRAQCMQQTSFICASINYRTGDGNCQLLAENTQTATISSSDSQWRYSVRPECAGIWQPWTATTGYYLNSGVQKYNQISTSDLRDCMSFCLQDEDISYNCSSIVKSVSGDQCEIVNKRSDDTGVTPEVNTDYQYFNLPLWYSDNSDSTTNTRVRNYGSAGVAFMLLFNYKIEADGYLVGWKYMIGRSTDYCDSYAAIWRQTGEGNSVVFNLITETLLTPEDASTGGIRFQFVQNSTEVVRKGDFLALYVEDLSISGCRGNLVSFRYHLKTDPQAYKRRSNPSRDRVDRLTYSNVVTEWRGVALRAYIAEILKLSGDPVSSHTDVSSGEIRITWEFPATTPNQELTTTHFKIECSDNSNFNTIMSSKVVSIDYRETVISNLTLQQPYYARVSTVRNYNGEELIQDVSTASSLFCAERGKLPPEDVIVTESGTLEPEEERMFTVSVTSLEADDCVSSVTFTHGSRQLSDLIKTGPWTLTKQQG